MQQYRIQKAFLERIHGRSARSSVAYDLDSSMADGFWSTVEPEPFLNQVLLVGVSLPEAVPSTLTIPAHLSYIRIGGTQQSADFPFPTRHPTRCPVAPSKS